MKYRWGVVATLLAMAAAGARGAFRDAGGSFGGHPAAKILERVFGGKTPADFKETGIDRADYLQLMAADVAFFERYQREDGAIIDPYSHSEIQYSTPSFALAAGTLVKEAGRKDLLKPACKAMSCALTALVTHHAANGHSDFYIPLLVHAYEMLEGEAPPESVAAWRKQFATIIPQKTYNMRLRGMNWNIVSSCGELLRRKDGLVAADQRDRQWGYLEESLQRHMKDITRWGLVEDPGAPMAYDAFSRIWLDEMMADGAYDGKLAGEIDTAMKKGALSALLLLSPSGEWANGGRSGMHNWNEAENLVIFEIEAARWKKLGRMDVAGAMKRGAHLAFESIKRWQRPSGELWIVKNRAEPNERLGFEPYSYHTQYNLLPMAMLAMAYAHADDSIAERPAPSEVGGYVFDLRQRFHKIAAAAGGYYVLIDTDADPHYNATGLQRVHRERVGFPALSDSCAAERAFGPKDAPKEAITPGIAWQEKEGKWRRLADFAKDGKWKVGSADLAVHNATPREVAFGVDYTLAGPGEEGRHVINDYTVNADGVTCISKVSGGSAVLAFRGEFPVLVSDGATDLPVRVQKGQIIIDDHGSETGMVVKDVTGGIQLRGPRVANHNGYVQRAVVPLKADRLVYQVRLQQKQ